MSTTYRKFLPNKKVPPVAITSVSVEVTDATDDAANFFYAVVAALGLNLVELTDDAQDVVTLQLNGRTILADNHQWHYPEHAADFEHWLVSTSFPRVDDPTVWAVVQTGTERFNLLSAAMAYAHRETGVLLIDADAAEALSHSVHEATDHAIETLTFDIAQPSPHTYVLNAPMWEGVNILLQAARTNPLDPELFEDTLKAAQHHFKHTIIDCGADLFLAQRLAATGSRVIHVDDCARPLYVDLTPYKGVDYGAHGIPRYGTGDDFESIVHHTRGRGSMRRWMKRGDAP